MVRGLGLQKLINELKHKVHSASFERLFAEKTAHLSGPQKLQLKIKLNELTKPSTAAIDLRRKVPGPVAMYEYQGRTHFFNAEAQKIFTDGLKANNGVYTDETYRNIMQYMRKQQQTRVTKQIEADSQSKLGSFVLGRYYRRSEERMNFVTDVVVKGRIDGKLIKLKAVTVDISLQGVQLKLPATAPVQKLLHQTVAIFYLGLAKEFVFDQSQPYSYQVLGAHEKDNQTYLRLRRDAVADDDALDKLLRGLLNGYKFRYKVNVDHVIHSVRAKGHESQWLQSQQGVPVIFSGNPEKTAYAIATESNSALIDSCCKKTPQLLNALINQRWLRLKLAEVRDHREQTRLQLPFYFLTLNVKGEKRHYAVPTVALAKQPAIKNILAGLKRAGYTVQALVLSVTYSRLDKLFVGLVSAIDLPDWKTVKASELKLNVLKPHRLHLQGVQGTKVVEEHPRLTQLYTKCGLCNALFVHREAKQQDIGLAALMPFKQGLPGWFQNPELWLSRSHYILGGKKIENEILKRLKYIDPAEHADTKTLLLRLSQSDNQAEPTVNGRWLSDFTSFNEASLYMKKLYKEKKLLAVNIELYRCKRPVIRAFRDDLNYVQTYLPHRAKSLERQIKSIDGVIGVQDVTAPLLRLAL